MMFIRFLLEKVKVQELISLIHISGVELNIEQPDNWQSTRHDSGARGAKIGNGFYSYFDSVNFLMKLIVLVVLN